MIISSQQNSKISVPVSLALDLPVGSAAIDMEEFMIYLVMRNWSKPCGEIDKVRTYLSNLDESDWIYELDGCLKNHKGICDYIYNVAPTTRSSYIKRTKLHIGSLICSGLIILRNKITGRLCDSNEYMAMTKEEWGTGEDFVFYFPVPVGFYTVSNSDLEKVIRFCKDSRDLEVSYFVTLFAILEYYFGISTDPSKCWMISPVSTFFTSRTSLWRRIKPVLEAVGITHTFKQYMDENGELKTKQIFERKITDSSQAETQEANSIYTPDSELPFDVEESEEESEYETITLDDGSSFVVPVVKAKEETVQEPQQTAVKIFSDGEFDYKNAKTPEEYMVGFIVSKCRDGVLFPKLMGIDKTSQEFMDYLYDVDNHDFNTLPEHVQNILLTYCPEDVIPRLRMTKDEILELKLKNSRFSS